MAVRSMEWGHHQRVFETRVMSNKGSVSGDFTSLRQEQQSKSRANVENEGDDDEVMAVDGDSNGNSEAN